MNTVEDFLDRNIRVLIDQARRDRGFGTSYVQRLCRIGYNQAAQTIERAVSQGLLAPDDSHDMWFKFATPEPEVECRDCGWQGLRAELDCNADDLEKPVSECLFETCPNCGEVGNFIEFDTSAS